MDLDEADAKISISGKLRRGERQRTADHTSELVTVVLHDESNGVPMGVPMVSCWRPMGFRRDSYGVPIGFLWVD